MGRATEPHTRGMAPAEHYREAQRYLATAEDDHTWFTDPEADPAAADRLSAQFDRHAKLAGLHRLMAETGLAFEKPMKVLLPPADGRTLFPLSADAWTSPPEAPADVPPMESRTTGPGYDVPTTMWTAIRNELTESMKRAGWHPPVPMNLVQGAFEAPEGTYQFKSAAQLSKHFKPGETISVSPAVAQQIIGHAFVGLNGHGLTMVRNESGGYVGQCVCGDFQRLTSEPEEISTRWVEHLDYEPDVTYTGDGPLCSYRFPDSKVCVLEADHEDEHRS